MANVDYNVEQILSGDLAIRQAIYLMRRGVEAVQTEHGLVVDGHAGPITRAAIDAKLGLPLIEPPALAVLPKGKGMFIRALTGAGTRAQVLAGMKQRGLSWVAIQRIWQYEVATNKSSSLYNSTTLANYAEDLRAAGHEVWLWGFPAPEKQDEFIYEMIGSAVQVKARGIIVDPELPFLATKQVLLATRMEQANALMTPLLIEAAKAGLGVGVTSYGMPDYFNHFPWKAFTGAHFGMPQIYDANNNMPKTYPTEAIAAWKKRGFKTIIPASAAFNRDAAGMADLLARTPAKGAMCWWDWYNCAQLPGRWDAVQSYVLEP